MQHCNLNTEQPVANVIFKSQINDQNQSPLDKNENGHMPYITI